MKTVGSRAEVWHGTAKKTSGGLLKKDLKKNKRGRIVSKKMSNRAKKEKRLEKAGYKTKKGVFKKFKAKKRGGENSNNNETKKLNKAKEKRLKSVRNVPMSNTHRYEYPVSYPVDENGEIIFEKIEIPEHATKFPIPNGMAGLIRNYAGIGAMERASMMNKKRANMYEKKHEKKQKKRAAKNITRNGTITINEALIEAVKIGYKTRVEFLLDVGANKDVRDVYGMTPLHWATDTYRPHIDIVKLLLDAGADKDVKDRRDRTPLHLAAEKYHPDVVKLLLDAGADKDVKNEDGRTPLHLAVDRGYTEIVKMLLDAGADKKVKDNYDDTPLDLAEIYGYTSIVKLLKSPKSKGGSKKRRKRKTTKRKTNKRKSKK